VVVEHLVAHAVADEHDLDLELDGLRLDAGAQEAAHRVLTRDLGAHVLEHALECRPHGGLEGGIEEVEDEVATVGAQQAAGADHREITAPDSLIEHALDASEQIAVRGRRLDDDRWSLDARIVDQDVYLVEIEGIGLRGLARGLGGPVAGCGGEPSQRLEHVLLHLAEPIDDARHFFVFLPQVVDGAAHELGAELAVEGLDGAAHLVFDGACLAHHVLELLLQPRVLLLDLR